MQKVTTEEILASCRRTREGSRLLRCQSSELIARVRRLCDDLEMEFERCSDLLLRIESDSSRVRPLSEVG